MKRTVSQWGDYIVGWRSFSVCGYYVEELLNTVKNENIEIWDIEKIDQCSISFKAHSFSVEKILRSQKVSRVFVKWKLPLPTVADCLRI